MGEKNRIDETQREVYNLGSTAITESTIDTM